MIEKYSKKKSVLVHALASTQARKSFRTEISSSIFYARELNFVSKYGIIKIMGYRI